MRSLVVELRGARQAVFSCREATSLTTKPLELADPTGWLLAWSLGGYIVAHRIQTMTQCHFCKNSYRRERCTMKAIVVTDQAAGTAGMKLVERPEPQGAA